MKKFIEYLSESQRTYHYRIKIAGDVSAEFQRGLRDKLAQFDPVKIGDLKSGPIQKTLNDFPGMENDRVHWMDVEFRYPAIHPQITSMAQMLGLDPNRVLMSTIKHDDDNLETQEAIQDQNQNLLSDSDYPKNSAEQERLKKDYAADAHDHEVLKNSYRSKFTVAGGKTPRADTTNELPQGKSSPIGGKNKLPRVTANAR